MRKFFAFILSLLSGSACYAGFSTDNLKIPMVNPSTAGITMTGSSGQTANYITITSSDGVSSGGLRADKSWIIPDDMTSTQNDTITFKSQATMASHYTTFEVKRGRVGFNYPFGTIFKLTDQNDSGIQYSAYMKWLSPDFTQSHHDLEIHAANGRVWHAPWQGGNYYYNGSAFSNLNEAALTIPAQTLYPGGGGPGYVDQSPLAIEQTTYATNSVTKIDHLSGAYFVAPTYTGATVPGNFWGLKTKGGINITDGNGEYWGTSSVQQRAMFSIVPSFTDSTDATRKARATLNVYDTAIRQAGYIEADGSAAQTTFTSTVTVSSMSVTRIRWSDGTVQVSSPPVAVSPGGSNQSIQFNNSGSFGGDSNFQWDTTNRLLNVNSSGVGNANYGASFGPTSTGQRAAVRGEGIANFSATAAGVPFVSANTDSAGTTEVSGYGFELGGTPGTVYGSMQMQSVDTTGGAEYGKWILFVRRNGVQRQILSAEPQTDSIRLGSGLSGATYYMLFDGASSDGKISYFDTLSYFSFDKAIVVSSITTSTITTVSRIQWADGTIQVSSPTAVGGAGDNMGNEVATSSMTMQGYGIFNIGTSSSTFGTNGNLTVNSSSTFNSTVTVNGISTGTFSSGTGLDMSAARLTMPNGTAPTCTGVGQECFDTTDNDLVIHDGSAQRVYATALTPFHVTISSWTDGWSNHSVKIFQAPLDKGITIATITACTSVVASTVTFQLEERGRNTPNTAGTDVFTVAQATANGTCAEYFGSAFTNPTMAAGTHIEFDTDSSASSGTVPDEVSITVWYWKDVE